MNVLFKNSKGGLYKRMWEEMSSDTSVFFTESTDAYLRVLEEDYAYMTDKSVRLMKKHLLS